MSASAWSGTSERFWISNAISLAPPCLGPRSAPMAPTMAECMSLPVPAITRAAKVEALNSCSAYRFSEVCIARAHAAQGLLPCSRCRKCAPMESSSVSGSMRLPWVDQWYQYSSMEPSEASSRSAMSRAPGAWGPSFSGSAQPSAATPLRSTAIGGALAGICSSAPLTLPRHAAAQHVHRVRAGRDLFQRRLDAGGHAAHGPEPGFIGAQPGNGGQLAVHQQVGDLLEFADFGDVQDV